MAKTIKTNKIQTTYKGFKLEVSREPSLTGDLMIFYSAFRQNDQWCLDDGCSEQTSLRSVMTDLKLTVDEYLENPENFED
jgi:hypothetical protein